MTTAVAPGATEMGVPPTVMGGPPGAAVCPPTTKAVAELAVTGVPPNVMTGAGAGTGLPGGAPGLPGAGGLP